MEKTISFNKEEAKALLISYKVVEEIRPMYRNLPLAINEKLDKLKQIELLALYSAEKKLEQFLNNFDINK